MKIRQIIMPRKELQIKNKLIKYSVKFSIKAMELFF